MGFIFGFVGALLVFAGILSALFGALPVALILLSPGLTFLSVEGVRISPGWAFERAHRGSKAVWLLTAILGLIPPFGLIYFALWVTLGRAVKRAWAAGDPASYNRYARRVAAARFSLSSGQSPWQTSSSTGGGGSCGVCGGRGWHYSDGGGNQMPCYACGGSGRR